MNFLAHLYLSGNDTNIIIGNFIADHIKGNKFKHLPLSIQKGIRLHREIDTFTDTHPVVKKSMHRLNERYGHYDGVIIDIFYDHFLAKNWTKYSTIPFDKYVQSIYTLLQDNLPLLPKKTVEMLPYMIQYNWLYNYQYLKGIKTVLVGMNKRTNGKSKMHLAIEDLKIHYNDFEKDFLLFFEDIRLFTSNKIQELLTVKTL